MGERYVPVRAHRHRSLPPDAPESTLRPGSGSAGDTVVRRGQNDRVPAAGYRRQLYRDDAVVLRVQKLGESDRIITLLTRRHGRLRAVARGVRRTTSRFGARLEPFGHVDVQLAGSPEGVGSSLHSVSQVEAVNLFGKRFLGDYPRYTAASAIAETAERLTPEEREPSLRLFQLTLGAHEGAGRWASTPAPWCSTRTCCAAMSLAGWAPALTECAVCGTPGRHGAFSVPAGGVRCARTAARPARPIPAPATLDLMSALTGGDWLVADAAEPPVRRECSGLVAAHLQWHLERGLRSLPLVDRREQRMSDGRRRTRPGRGRRSCRSRRCRSTWRSSWTATAGGPRSAACPAPRATSRGSTRLFDTVEGAIELGVPYLSAYAFSTENWKRSPEEVRFLMGFNRDVIRRRRDQLVDLGVRVVWSGRAGRLWKSVISELQTAEEMSQAQHDADPAVLRQLRRPGRDRRRGRRDRPGRGRRPAQARQGQREDDREVPLPPGGAGGGPVPAPVRRAAHVELPALAVRVRRDGLSWTRSGRTSTAATSGTPASCTPSATAASAARCRTRSPRR